MRQPVTWKRPTATVMALMMSVSVSSHRSRKPLLPTLLPPFAVACAQAGQKLRLMPTYLLPRHITAWPLVCVAAKLAVATAAVVVFALNVDTTAAMSNKVTTCWQ